MKWTDVRREVTMGSMSASDAAPLPRLGEVFFDVRGSSRSMRLSWYADTGIAVFSIWQGGTCTGTFRLPMDDLPRLMDSLRRGMQGTEDDSEDSPQPPQAQRPRLALGAAPEPYTGALIALPGPPSAQRAQTGGHRAQPVGQIAQSGDDRSYADVQGYDAPQGPGDSVSYPDGPS